ncbi:hypothetical protein BC833DRAFT_562939 [Globomyces pollinis-pini]|nr:hypothetical protein BC833DRAFT_562939 [Globomyces pollinis-pini]KAJ3000550.1 hypothetical protein HDV02_004845 [Globomyces sp. JEL0801]KAJ3000571.1 hypothetical protein HDV02_004866 [Globomyces sp. JEL0801]
MSFDSHSQITDPEESQTEPCLSEMYALLQTSISSIEHSPHESLDTLTLLMEQICSQQEALQNASPMSVRLEFWRQVNATWIFVIESVLKARVLAKADWRAVCETVVAVGNVLALYGMVDYDMGFAEAKIIQIICDGISDLP